MAGIARRALLSQGMSFVIDGLDPTPFLPLFTLSDLELAARGVRRQIVDERPGSPCRVSLDDADIGDEVLLVTFRHHDVNSPYRGEGPIFVRRNARRARFVDALPPMLASRMVALRAYDAAGMMVTADLVRGVEAHAPLDGQLRDARVAYVHLHLARAGCFLCRIDRA